MSIASEFVKLNHRVTVLTYNTKSFHTRWRLVQAKCSGQLERIERKNGLTIRRFPYTYALNPAFTFSIAETRALSSISPDVLHAQGFFDFPELYLMLSSAKQSGIPSFITTHGFFEVTTRVRRYHLEYAFRAFLRLITDMTSKYIVLSSLERTELMNLGVPPSKIAVIPNGVDIEQMDRGLRESPILDDTSGEFVFCAARFSKNKNLELLVRVFDSVDTSTKLVIAGRLTDPTYFQRLKAQIDTSKITLLPNAKDSEMRWLYQNCLFTVLPSSMETSPLVILEAMAASKPVVASDVGAISSLIVNGETGILVSPTNPGDIAKGLVLLMRNEGLRLSMGKKARSFAESRSWRHAAELTLSVMEEFVH